MFLLLKMEKSMKEIEEDSNKAIKEYSDQLTSKQYDLTIEHKIEVLKKAKVDFSVLELMELVRKYPNFTFTQAFKVVQKKVELICKIKFEILDNRA